MLKSRLSKTSFRDLGARFWKVPKTFRARKAICETVNLLFRKADVLTWFQGNKKQNGCEVWRLLPSPF